MPATVAMRGIARSSVAAATLAVAGCAGSAVGTMVPPPHGGYVQVAIVRARLGLHVRPEDASREILYVSHLQGSAYDAYRLPHTKSFCTGPGIYGSTAGSIAATRDGTVWLPISFPVQIPQSQPPTGIYAYASRCGSQVDFLSVPSSAQPIGITFGKSGTAYGLTFYSTQSELIDAVEVYPKGATSPTAEFTDPRLEDAGYSTAAGIGVDSSGKVYVSCCGSLHPFVIVFSGQGSQTHGTQIFLKDLGAAAASISFDKSGNMLVPDLRKWVLAVYAPPYKGRPHTHRLKGEPGECGLNLDETLLVCGDESAGTGDIFSYPSMKYLYSVVPSGYQNSPGYGAAFVPSH